MTTLTVSVDIDASPEQTWNVVTDWVRQGEWMPMTHVTMEPGSGTGLGARLSARSGVGFAGFLDPMVVDVWEPPHRCEVEHQGRVVTGRGVFIVDALPGGRSRFTWQEVLDSSGVRRFVDRAGGPPTRVLLTVALRRLAKVIEAEGAR